MELPFSESQFLDVFQQYNTTLDYGILALWIVTIGVVVVWIGFKRFYNDKWVIMLLIIHWLWAAILYHVIYFSSINPAAWLFGLLFLIQAGLLGWYGLKLDRLRFSSQSRTWKILAITLVVYSIAYPALGIASGLAYPRMATFGVPCPVTLLTTGFLLSTTPPAPRPVIVVPILWSLIGGSAAFLLNIYTDWALFIAALLLLIHTLMKRPCKINRK